MYISIDELKTHLHSENISVIANDDDTILVAALDAAVEEAKGYLSAFDKEKIFSAEGNKRNSLLLIFVKDIAVWHFVNLCNAGTDLRLRQDRYERAIDWLKNVQKGNISPDLPVLDKDEDGQPDVNMYAYGSNPKRKQHI